ncbi:hypothetical protein [Virgibacillus oceani]|uniref:Uncharacterized protein n=1 Tax=Virgibacillus oceani TaxID=1479511 RepID=A0A917H8D9_9BACI|nr:hypothetical protein [Virgibacillus oceani]GGG70726.1 hypothetical protein GCM10011398_13590 [Virgibacillus oceani]
MSPGLLILLIIIFIAALAGTIVAFKQEERKLKKYEEEGDSIEDQLRRSHEYETSSLKSNVPLLLIIYTITIVLSLIVFAVYII